MSAPGWFSDEVLRKRAGAVPAIEEQAWANLGALMSSIFGANEPRPGPPYTHTFRPPQEHYTRSGKLLYWEKPGPAYTLTEGK